VVETVAALLAGVRPHVVVTFNTLGITLHEDHIAICEITTEAFHRARERGSAGDGAFQRLLYNAVPMSRLREFWSTLRRLGIDLGDPDAKYMPHGTPDEDIAVLVDVRSVYDAKRTALRAHRTQAGGLVELPEPLLRRFLGTEAFIQAWSPRAPGTPVAADLFAGLERG
jgi:N-acetyl-1-D-myo-inositol-2-amino-2-deoxy-alpha-D-glucopyranoside deacetylase